MAEVTVYKRADGYIILNQILKGGIMTDESCETERLENGLRVPGSRDSDNKPAPPIPEPQLVPPEVTIKPLAHGYIVTIGCQQFAIESSLKLTKMLLEYLRHPIKTRKAWLNNDKENKYFPKFDE